MITSTRRVGRRPAVWDDDPVRPDSQPAPAGTDVLTAAVDPARAAAEETAGDPGLVGEHLGATAERPGAAQRTPAGPGRTRGRHAPMVPHRPAVPVRS